MVIAVAGGSLKNGFAAGGFMNADPRQGILLAAFGSGSRQGESTLRLFDARVRERFPGLPVRWAFTSVLMRERLATARKKADSVGKALRRMAFEGFSRIALQPLHVAPGLEYREVMEEAARFTAETRRRGGRGVLLAVGEPLLSGRPGSLERACRAMLASVPPERQPDEAVIWMGHGSRHPSSARYTDLGEQANDADPLVFVGTINGETRLEDLLPRLAGTRRAWLLPLLSVVGRHALEDMAGASPASWKSRLEAAGIEGLPVLRGMVEAPAFTEIWLNHLAAILTRPET